MTTTQRYFFDIRLDRGGTEVLTLDLETDCLGSICHLSGQLTSGTSEHFDVRGIRFGNRVYLEFPFRRVKIVMGGVRDSNDKFHMRFIAAPRDQLLAESSVVPPIDPDVGDTGTGTATQTFVNEENPMRRAS